MSATSFVLDGVDLMGIAEVHAELRRLKRFAPSFDWRSSSEVQI